MRPAALLALALTLCLAALQAAPLLAQAEGADEESPAEVLDEPVMVDGTGFLEPDAGGDDTMERLQDEVFGGTGSSAGDDNVETPGGRNSDTLFFPDLPENFVADEETLQSMQRAVQAYYGYRVQQFDHRARVFEWQHRSTQLIFGVVVLIVAAGLYFSWMQFHASKSGTESGTSTFEASGTGFKVSSPVVGVIVLALSLAFFYLYLIHVYPITDLF